MQFLSSEEKINYMLPVHIKNNEMKAKEML